MGEKLKQNLRRQIENSSTKTIDIDKAYWLFILILVLHSTCMFLEANPSYKWEFKSFFIYFQIGMLGYLLIHILGGDAPKIAKFIWGIWKNK